MSSNNNNVQTRHFVQISHKHQSDFQEIKTDEQKQYKASQSLHLTKFADFKSPQKENQKKKKSQNKST